jgi:hypothetical protein
MGPPGDLGYTGETGPTGVRGHTGVTGPAAVQRGMASIGYFMSQDTLLRTGLETLVFFDATDPRTTVGNVLCNFESGILTNTRNESFNILVTGSISLDEDVYQSVYIKKNDSALDKYSNIITSGKATAFSGVVLMNPGDSISIYIRQDSGANISIVAGGTRVVFTQLDYLLGPTGWTGSTGFTGWTGPTGVRGVAGSATNTGATGPTGWTGPQGVPGTATNTGATGDMGPPGEMGHTGPQGLAGAATNTGATGDVGPVGDVGPPGDFGFTGPTGMTGDLGPPGDLGAPGDLGYTGPTGNLGPTGPTSIGSTFSLVATPFMLPTTPTLLSGSTIMVATISNLWIMSTIEYRTLDTPNILSFYIQVGSTKSIITNSSTSTYNQRTVITLQTMVPVGAGAHIIGVYGSAPNAGVAEIRHCDVFGLSNIS